MAQEFDWAYPEAIGGGGWTQDDSSERRRQDRDDAGASAQVPVNTGAIRIHTLSWKLEWGLMEVLVGLAGGESGRRGELTSAVSMADWWRRVLVREEEAAFL
jgi:hypothetical protein